MQLIDGQQGDLLQAFSGAEKLASQSQHVPEQKWFAERFFQLMFHSRCYSGVSNSVLTSEMKGHTCHCKSPISPISL